MARGHRHGGDRVRRGPSYVGCMNAGLAAHFTDPIGPGYVPTEEDFNALGAAAEICNVAGLSGWRSVVLVSEHEGDPWGSGRHFGDGVAPGALARTAHDDEIALTERVRHRCPARGRAQQEPAGPT